ncbi:hypothetical protein RCL1_004120 [Eukaryota sp. TZLM3-RCL]
MGKAERDGKYCYYLDDGIYGCYSGIIWDYCHYPRAFIRGMNSDEVQDCTVGDYKQTILYGPTCDSIDVIGEDVEMEELEIGDLVVGFNMGAYSWVTATDFNFWDRTSIVSCDFE